MQTMEAFLERRWGQYPHLAQLVSDNQPSVEWTGPTSVSSNIFKQVDDLLNVYVLVADKFEEIQQQSRKDEGDNLKRDLSILSEHLNWMSKFFKDASNNITNI